MSFVISDDDYFKIFEKGPALNDNGVPINGGWTEDNLNKAKDTFKEAFEALFVMDDYAAAVLDTFLRGLYLTLVYHSWSRSTEEALALPNRTNNVKLKTFHPMVSIDTDAIAKSFKVCLFESLNGND